MAFVTFLSPLRQRLGGWSGSHPWEQTWKPLFLALELEHILGLLGDGCVSFWGLEAGKGLHGLFSQGPQPRPAFCLQLNGGRFFRWGVTNLPSQGHPAQLGAR